MDEPLKDGPSTGGRLIVVCGLPGAGKTTLAKLLESSMRAVRLAPDEWMDALGINLYDAASRARIESLQWTLAQELLRLGVVVIVEWGTWGRSERDALRLGARAIGAAVELRYVSATADILYERIRRRAREDPPITREALSQWLEAFHAPTDDEMALFDPPLEPANG